MKLFLRAFVTLFVFVKNFFVKTLGIGGLMVSWVVVVSFSLFLFRCLVGFCLRGDYLNS